MSAPLARSLDFPISIAEYNVLEPSDTHWIAVSSFISAAYEAVRIVDGRHVIVAECCLALDAPPGKVKTHLQLDRFYLSRIAFEMAPSIDISSYASPNLGGCRA